MATRKASPLLLISTVAVDLSSFSACAKHAADFLANVLIPCAVPIQTRCTRWQKKCASFLKINSSPLFGCNRGRSPDTGLTKGVYKSTNFLRINGWNRPGTSQTGHSNRDAPAFVLVRPESGQEQKRNTNESNDIRAILITFQVSFCCVHVCTSPVDR